MTVSDRDLQNPWRNAGALFVNGGFESESIGEIANLLREVVMFLCKARTFVRSRVCGESDRVVE